MEELDQRVQALDRRVKAIEKSDRRQQILLMLISFAGVGIVVLNVQNISEELKKNSETFLGALMTAMIGLVALKVPSE